MFKKIMSTMLIVAITAGIAIGGTVAYLTDRDSKANVFTVGNVGIELVEDFEQGSKLTPGVDVNKDIQIKNTGANEAWVWYTYAIPKTLDTAGDASANVLHVNHAGKNWLGYQNNQAYWDAGQTEATPETQCWIPDYNPTSGNGNPIGEVELDGIVYNVYAVLYNGKLAKDATTTIGMTKVYMDTNVDIDTNGDWYLVDKGAVTGPIWNTGNGNPVIYVSAYAIQAEGFDTVQDAYKAYNDQWAANGTEYAPLPTNP